MKISKAVLVCFSPTGGTRNAGRLAAARLGVPVEEVDVTANCPERSFASDELAVFAFPVYGGRIPAPMIGNLQKLKADGTPAVMLASFGNRAVDDAYLEMSDTAEKLGFVTVAGAEFVEPHSVDKSYGAGRPDYKDIEIMDEFIQKLKEKLEAADRPEHFELPGNRPYREYNGIPIKPKYKAKKCVSCGACFSHCPTGAIDKSKPEEFDSEKCISCMGCVSVCQKGARYIPLLMRFTGKMFLKKACSERQEPKYYI